MRVLLDTNALLWAALEPSRLRRQRRVVEDPDTSLLLSVGSAWEVAIKYGTGRLGLPSTPEHWVPDAVERLGALVVRIELAHVLAVADLPPIHRDPFDRLLVAQARHLGVPILTADADLGRYDVVLLPI